MSLKQFLIAIFSFSLMLSAYNGQAQSPSFGAQYFKNQYLINPAMAGIDSGLTVYLGHIQPMDNISGAAGGQALTATYKLGQLTFGINALNSKYGLFKNTSASASVTYSQAVGDDDQQLHFGVSFGGEDDRIDINAIDGDIDDVLVNQFNDEKMKFIGNFGVAYTGQGLTVQVSVPRFNTAFKKDDETILIGQTKLFTAISYSFDLEDHGIAVEPKLAYRMLNGFDDVIDAGARVSFMDNRFDVQGLYHTSKNFTIGASMAVFSKYSFIFLYSTPATDLGMYTKGNLEFGLKLNF